MIFVQNSNQFFRVKCPKCEWSGPAHAARYADQTEYPDSVLACPLCETFIERAERPWVYIAGPISLGDTHRHVRAAMATWKYLWQSGAQPICPHWSALQQMSFPVSWEEWLEFDLAIIARCDAVLRLRGESKGADREVEEARKLSVPVFDDVTELLKHLKGTT